MAVAEEEDEEDGSEPWRGVSVFARVRVCLRECKFVCLLWTERREDGRIDAHRMNWTRLLISCTIPWIYLDMDPPLNLVSPLPSYPLLTSHSWANCTGHTCDGAHLRDTPFMFSLSRIHYYPR